MAVRSRLLLLLLVPALLSCRGREEAQSLTFPRAPVILISIDTLRSDHLPAYGYRGVETPNLDRLRSDAVLFVNAWSHCPMTLPSHLSMLTGLLPPEHGVRDNVGFRFDASHHQTLASLLHEKGYATGAAVSAHVLRSETGMGSGFDSYDDALDIQGGARFTDYQRNGAATESIAERWIGDHKSSPFFYFLHLYEPHVPYDPPEPFRSRHQNRYDGEIATSDAIVGRFLDRLRALGLYDRALIMLTSDHGEGLGDHGEQQHSILIYREALQVPLLVKLPRSARAGQTVAANAQLIDLFPTVTSLLGIEAGAGRRGLSLFAAGRAADERPVYSESLYGRLHFGWSALRSVVEAKRHLIAAATQSELYDLGGDVREGNNLADANRRDVVAMRRTLDSFPAATAVPARVDPEEAAKLAAIGYVGTANAGPEQPVNPRDRIGIVEDLRTALEAPPEQSIKSLRALTAAHPEMVELWMQLAASLSQQGQFAEAADAYRNAMNHASGPSTDALLGLGNAALQLGRLDEARRSGELALSQSPRDAQMLLARVALARNDVSDAERLVRSAAGNDPRPSDDVLLAEIAVRRGAFDEAMHLLDQAGRRASATGVAHVYRLDAVRGDVLARTGNVSTAIAAYEREIVTFPNDLHAYANLAVLQFVSGNAAAKERTLDAMIKANPTSAARALAAKTRATLK